MATKNKTSKSLKKRLKVTGTGQIMFQTSGKRHLNAHFTPKQRRQLRRVGMLPKALVKKYLIAMGEY